jgi:chromosome segregation protein
MKIKKVELVGFKSFVDRTVIHIDEEVIAIVGPNGCGKSNIVDAIRWCMGEMSAKQLRGKSMEDVLFGGSESRAAVDMCEVTLTFENDNPSELPPEHRDYSEIAVSRRLHRTGESEYFINKTSVRLKDVTDLFLGTGVGTKAYSIVEQGRIGLIVSAKPEDRRLLIEEAAGITKYKSRKRQAERKMELTQQNLLRVGDIVAEIERNLGSLKRQAQKAERYLAYRNELEDLLLTEAAHRYLELDGWVKFHRLQTAELTTRAEETRTALAVREAELETARLEARGAEETLEKAQTEAFARTNDVRAEEAEIARGRDRIEALKLREAQMVGELAELAEQRDRLAAERDVVLGEVAELEAEESDCSIAALHEEERLSALSAELAQKEAALAELRLLASHAEANIAASEAKLDASGARQDELRARLQRCEVQREDERQSAEMHEARARALGSQLEGLREGKVVTAEERAQLEASLQALRTEILASERGLEAARNDLAHARSRWQALLEMQARFEGVGAGTRALVETKDPAIVGLVADRIEAPAELTAALAGLLGPRLEDVVVSDHARGLELLEALERNEQGRATIIPLRPRYVAGTAEAIPDIDGVLGRLCDRLRYDPSDEPLVRSLIGDAIVVRDASVAATLREYVHSAPIVTLRGMVFWPDGRVAGGAGDSVAAGLIETKREARELGEKVRELEAIAEEKLGTHQALRTAIIETQAKLDAARQRAHERDLALVTCEKDLRSAEEAAIASNKRIAELERDIEEIAVQLATQQDDHVKAEIALKEARDLLGAQRERIAEAERVRAEANERVQAQRLVVTEHKVELAGTREKLGAARAAVSRLDRSVLELSDRTKRIESDVSDAAWQYGETAAHIAQHREALQIALDRARDAEDALQKTRADYEAMRAQLLAQEAQIKDLRAEADAAKEDLVRAEMALREKELELEHLLLGVADKFRGLELPRVIGDYHMRTALSDEQRARIEELTGLIDRMGSVNLDAVREHEEADKRFRFYSEQKADLEKALADLTKAIQQMNRESKRLFTETFEAVNAKFQEVFPKMFRGGRASLRLTNPEDMLETGIDILAQPPGKKLANIELMSGGEKALTAVSLIFAIFQVKPSPFCILDEVDAPLDEANVARYNEMIREMTDRSQFILITHIKRTMQSADVLYGVTMQEAGVSRLVSVDLKNAGDKTLESRRKEPARVKKVTDAEATSETGEAQSQVA